MIKTYDTKFKFRWIIVLLLLFATAINYIDRQVIGILKPFISKDLHWDDADYGYIITAFQISYAIGLLITGPFLDRFGTKVGYVWAVILWSLAGVAHAVASSVSGFAIARSVLGVGEAANFPAAVKSIAEWFPRKDRALAVGLFNSGSTIGAISAPVIVSCVTLSLGWRWAFIITGSSGLIWVILWLIIYQKPSLHPKLSADELSYINQDEDTSAKENKIGWINLLNHRQTYAICATRFISDWIWWFYLFWIPDYLKLIKNLNIKELVMPLIIIYSVSSFGGIGGGWLSSYLIKSGVAIDKARKNTILLCALLVLPIICISYTSNIWYIILLLSLAAAGHQGWAANIFTIISDIYPKTAIGSMMGISGFFGAIGGALSASFVGILLQTTHSYALIFTVASTMYLVNWLIIKISIPVIKPIEILQNGI